MATSKIKSNKSTLWEGTWESGSISVPNSDKYSVFIVYQSGTPLIAFKNEIEGSIDIFGYGISGYTGTDLRQITRAFRANTVGTTWTLTFSNVLRHDVSSNHNAGNASPITKIDGLF